MKKLFSVFMLCLALASCGFTLRSQNDIPAQMRQLYLQSNTPYAQFESSLRQTLTLLKVNVVSTPTGAPITLGILSTSFNYSAPNLSTSTQAQSFTYTYTVTFQVLTNKGKILLPPKTIYATGILILQPNEILGSNVETNILEQQLQQSCLNQILYILGSAQLKHALAKVP